LAANVVVVASNVRRIPSQNLGTSRSNCFSVIVICIPAKFEMSGSILQPEVPTGSRIACPLTVLYATWV
jgi:hypothetical protein